MFEGRSRAVMFKMFRTAVMREEVRALLRGLVEGEGMQG